jgi:predicted RNA-binding Zn-ribbon protein involved in translation (DUF1610 family)
MELLTVIAAAIVIVGLVWYLRGRRVTTDSDAETQHNHRTAALLADDVHTEALVRHYCPQCGVERDFRDRTCVECGYRLTA